MGTKRKSKQALYGWTDYPIEQLGDKPGELAPIRPIKVVAYDRDKRIIGYVKNKRVQIKAGYCYRTPGRVGSVKALGHSWLVSLPSVEPL